MEVVYAGDFEMKKRNRIESCPWLYRRAAADAQGALLFLSFPRFCSRTGTCAHVSVQRKLKAPLHPISLIFIIGCFVIVFVFFSGLPVLACNWREKVKGEISPVQFDGPSLYRVL